MCKIEFLPVSVSDVESFKFNAERGTVKIDEVIYTRDFFEDATNFLDNHRNEKAEKNGALNEKLAIDLVNATSNEERVSLRKQYEKDKDRISNQEESHFSFKSLEMD